MASKMIRVADKRTGTVMVEFVIVAPLLFLFFFAAFEFCRVAMIRHTADNAVYEGARIGIIPGATSGEARAEAERILSSLGLSTFEVNVKPGKIESDTEQVTVQVKVPLDGNSFVPNQFVNGKKIKRELTMYREGVRRSSSTNSELVQP